MLGAKTVGGSFKVRPDSGLLVPEEQVRNRQVWTRDEWKQMNRASGILNGHGVAVLMRCSRPDCPDSMLRPERLADGSSVLRCGCTDRVLSRSL